MFLFLKWKKPEPKIKTGYMARYAKMVSSAGNGAVFNIGMAKE